MRMSLYTESVIATDELTNAMLQVNVTQAYNVCPIYLQLSKPDVTCKIDRTMA